MTASPDSTSAAPAAGSFLAAANNHLAELDIYVTSDTSLQSDCVESIYRRFLLMRDEAAKEGYVFPNVELAIAGLDALRKTAAKKKATPELPEGFRAIISALVEFLHAWIKWQEKVNQGQHLPEGLEPFFKQVQEELTAQLQDDTDSEAPGQMPLRILIADDEEMICQYLNDIFLRSEMTSMYVHNGVEAVTCVETGLFDLVFTDINMPGMDGLELLKKSKAIQPDLEVVIVTGFASLENATQALRDGAYDYLTKPFKSISDVENILHRAQDHIRLQKSNKRLVHELHRRNKELARFSESLQDALLVVDEKQKALLHADRMATLGVLSAGVAHEINNPTTFIRGNLQSLQKFWEILQPVLNDLRESSDNPRLPFILDEMPNLIEDMNVGTERITRIVSGLRSFAHQGESNRDKPVNLNEALEGALALVHNKIKGKIQVEKDLDSELPLIQADMQQLGQVFVNLLMNAADALDHTRNGVIRLRTYDDGETVCAVVEDNGPGIDPKIREKIFTPFFTTKDVGKGTGLGLSILLGIVRDHGGDVEAENGTDGHGTRFTIRLPKKQEKGTHQKEHRNKRQVFVIDDEEKLCRLFTAAIRATGQFEVESFLSSQKGLEAILENPPSAVVMDVMMPHIDGFEMLDRIASLPEEKRPKTICITALGMNEVEKRLRGLGADEVFFKPCKIVDVLATLESLTRAPDL